MGDDASGGERMSIQCRITALKAGLDLGIRRHTALPKPDRAAYVSAEEDFLALSWQGDLDYWRRIDLDHRVEEQSKTPGNSKVSKENLRRLNLGPMLERYAEKRKLLYIFERIVFFKTSHLIPKSLEKLTSECDDAYREAPLHRYIVLERCQKPADKGVDPVLGCWQVQPIFHLGDAELAAALLAEIYPKPLPKSRKCWLKWLWIICIAVLVSAMAAATVLLTAPELRDWILPRPDHIDRSELESLREQLAAMGETDQALRDQLAANSLVDAVTELHLGELDREIAELWARMAALPVSGTQMDRIGEAACLPVRREGDRVFPTFLYAITLDREATLSLRPLADGLDAARLRGFTDLPDQPAFQLGIPAFESLVRPVSAQAQARSCRHFVLLIENDPQDAQRYIARREAVERHFYVFRP